MVRAYDIYFGCSSTELAAIKRTMPSIKETGTWEAWVPRPIMKPLEEEDDEEDVVSADN